MNVNDLTYKVRGAIYLKQLLTYLKLTGKPIGLLVNFNTADMDKNIKRLVNGTIGNQ